MTARRVAPRRPLYRVIRFVAAVCLPWTAAAGARAACSFGAGESVTVRGIDAWGDLRLADGRSALLADLDIAAGVDRDAMRDLLAERAAHARLTLDPLQAQPDRWGRTIARLFSHDAAGQSDWVEERLVARGLARVAPRWESPDCARVLLQDEAKARAEHAGLWADPRRAVIAASALRAAAPADGAFVVVEGRIVDVGTVGEVVYLNFGLDRRRDLALVASRAVTARFKAEGVALNDAAGRRVRARGRLETARGLRIELETPEQIEWLTPADDPSAH